MKKTIVIAIVMILAVLGVAVAIKYTQGTSPVENNAEQKEESTGNAASEISENEVRYTEENFQKEVREYKGVALVDFYLPTCPHCIKLGPVITEIAQEYKDKEGFKIGKINAQIASNLSTEFKIESVPCIIFFKDGKEVARLIGEQPKDVIVSKLEEVSK